MPTPRKRFGQHFLNDQQIIEQILLAIDPQVADHLVEIGPGQGAITIPLLKKVGQMDVIELDRDLIPSLRGRCAGKGKLNLFEADALEFDYNQLYQNNEPLRLVGNLPYNISTPLIFYLLEFAKIIKDMHFMLQKEVVDRLAATPGNKDYGRLSIMVQYHCDVVALFDVPADAFYPSPRVESSVVRLLPYTQAPFRVNDYEKFSNIVKQAFSQRRKTLRNCLKTMISDEFWEKIGIDSTRRPEELSVEDYVRMSNAL